MPSSPGPRGAPAWEPNTIIDTSPRRERPHLSQPFMIEEDRGLTKDEIQILTKGGQEKDIPVGEELENFRPFAHYFHPNRYGVQKWRLFKIRIPMKIQKQLHSFLDSEVSIAEMIQYWGARMVYSFGAPKNLMLSILTDYTWFTTLLLVEALVEGKLEALREALFYAFQNRKVDAKDNAVFGEVRKEYFQTVNVMKDQMRFMSEDATSQKAAVEAMLAQLCGPDDISFINSEVWLNLDDTQKELLKEFLRDRLKSAFQSGRQAMKQVMGETVQNLVNAQRERDSLQKKLDLMSKQKDDAELALSQRDKLITALKGTSGNAEFLDQIQALQDKIKHLQEFFRTTEQEKLALENKIRKLEETGSGQNAVVAAMMPVDDQESAEDLKKQIATLKAQAEQALREKRELEKKLKLAEKEIERMGAMKADTAQRAADSRPASSSSTGKGVSAKGTGADGGLPDFAVQEMAKMEAESSLLRDKVDGLEQSVDMLQGENMDLKNEINRLLAELAASKKDAAQARKDASKLEGKMAKMEERMGEMAEKASAAGVAMPAAQVSPDVSPSSRAMSSPDDLDNIDQYRGPMDSDNSRLPSREKSAFGGSRRGLEQSEEEWIFPNEAPMNARSEPREVRVQGLSGYKMKEVDDKVAKITEVETGKEFRVQRKIVEKRTWVFVDAHPDAEELTAVKKMRPGTVPVPEAMLPLEGDSPLEVARQVAGVPYAHSMSSGSKPGSRGAASSQGGSRPYSKPASSVGRLSAGAPSGGAHSSESDREWAFRDLGNDQGEVTYAGVDDKKRGQSYKVQNKVQEKRNVYVPIEDNPILNENGEPVAQELTIEQVLNPEQMRRNADRFEVVGAEEGNTRVVVDKESKEQFLMQKATRVEVDPKTQQIRRLEKLVAQLRADLEEKEVYAKKLEAAVTELQSKFTDMKQALSKAGVKNNLIDAALKDSGITNLLFGAKSIRKVYERLYQDALDRMIRQENRAGKHWSGQQRSLMSVLHTSGSGEMTADDQRKMYQEFYKGFETFEAALQKRARTSAIIRKASPKSSPKRYRTSEEVRRNLNAYVSSNFYSMSRISATSTDEPSLHTRSLLGESSMRSLSPRTQRSLSPERGGGQILPPGGGGLSQHHLMEATSRAPLPAQPRLQGHFAEASGRKLIEEAGVETLRIGEPGPRLGSREASLRVRDPRSSNKFQTPMKTSHLYYGDPPDLAARRTSPSPPPFVPHEIGAGLNVTSFNLLHSPTLELSHTMTHAPSMYQDTTEKETSQQIIRAGLTQPSAGPVGSALKNTTGGARARGLTPATTIGSGGLMHTTLASALDYENLRVGQQVDLTASSQQKHHERQTSSQALRRGPPPRSASPEMLPGGQHYPPQHRPVPDLSVGKQASSPSTQSKRLVVAQLPTPKRLDQPPAAMRSGSANRGGARGFLVDEDAEAEQLSGPVPSFQITSYESTHNSSVELFQKEASMKHSQSVTLPILTDKGNSQLVTNNPPGSSTTAAGAASTGAPKSRRNEQESMGHAHFLKKQPSQQRFSNRMKFLVSMNNPSGLPDQ